MRPIGRCRARRPSTASCSASIRATPPADMADARASPRRGARRRLDVRDRRAGRRAAAGRRRSGSGTTGTKTRQQFDHPAMLAGIRDGRLVRLLVGGVVSSGRLDELVREVSGEFVRQLSAARPRAVPLRAVRRGDRTRDARLGVCAPAGAGRGHGCDHRRDVRHRRARQASGGRTPSVTKTRG